MFSLADKSVAAEEIWGWPYIQKLVPDETPYLSSALYIQTVQGHPALTVFVKASATRFFYTLFSRNWNYYIYNASSPVHPHTNNQDNAALADFKTLYHKIF